MFHVPHILYEGVSMSYSFSLVLYEHIPSLQEGNLVLLFVFPEKIFLQPSIAHISG